MSTDSVVKASNWRLVEVGRVVLVKQGQSAGKLATIVEIIDQKRVCFTDYNETEIPCTVPSFHLK